MRVVPVAWPPPTAYPSCGACHGCITASLHPLLSAQKTKAKERKKRQKEEAKMKEMGLEPPPKPVQHVGPWRVPGRQGALGQSVYSTEHRQ